PLYWTHSDYPFLLPAVIAGGWVLTESDTTTIPTALGFFFTAGIMALLIGSACVLQKSWRGLAAGLAVAAMPDFLLHGSYQHADVPLGFYFLLTLVFVQFSDRFNSRSALFAAGLSASLAAWTKNEGLLFVLVLVFAWTASAVLLNRRENLWQGVLSLVLGAAPVMAIIIGMKFTVAPANDLFSESETIGRKLLDLSRYVEVASGYWNEISAMGGGPVNALVAAGALLAFIGSYSRGLYARAMRPAQLCTVLVATLMFAGYFMVYVITPHSIEWHMATSFERLIVQLWPLVVLAAGCYRASFEPQVRTAPESARSRWLTPAAAVLGLSVLAISSVWLRSAEAPADSREVVSQETANTGSLVSGYAEVLEGSSLAFLRSTAGESMSETVMAPSLPVRSATIPVRFDEGNRTSIAIVNTENDTARITVEQKSRVRTFDLPPKNQITKYLDESPFDIEPRAETVTISSSAKLLISPFLTYDPSGSDFLIVQLPAASVEGMSRGTLQVPYFASNGEWSTELVLVNPSSETLSGSHVWLDATGVPLLKETYKLPSKQSLVYKFPVKSTSVAGRIEIIPAGDFAPGVSAILFHRVGGLRRFVDVPSVQAATQATLFVEASSSIRSEIVIVNPGVQTASVRATLAGKDSTLSIAPMAISNVPLQHLAGYQLLPHPSRNAVHIAADVPIAAAVTRWYRKSPEREVSAVYGSLIPGRFFGYFVSGSGFSTEFVAYGAFNNRAFLRFFDSTGASVLPSLSKNQR
ncbi:MAG: hypothetical protein HY646_12995, partial [Acidobacteria bacterium]|nr:hypothetical protein [Acidobacteriota bacterium]